MSRTFRRKNIEHGRRYWDHWHFTEWDDDNNRVVLDKVNDAHKWKQAWHRCHAESHPYERSPGKKLRRYREKQFRALVRRELVKTTASADYEPLITRHGKRNWWDWS